MARDLGADASSTLAAGGKRLRPMLVLLCAGPDAGEGAIRAAVAIELVHMATLVHDDVLDAAPLRRGRPTVVATSGRDRATAVGDLLFSRAFAELGDAGAAPSDDAIAAGQAAHRFRAPGGPAGGRLGGPRPRRAGPAPRRLRPRRSPPERYLARCLLKTARLFECACAIGRDDPAADEALTGFGRDIGLAFQLLDDVLDITGPPERTGKARGTDLLDGTVTLPLIAAMREDPSLGEVDLRSLDEASAGELCDRIEATGALDEVREDARARVEAAKHRVGAAPIPDAQRELLGLVADGVVERYS